MPGSIASYTARSTTSIATTRSRTQAGSRKMTLKWWERRPILPNAWLIDLQKGSYLASIYSLLQSLLQISLAVFDIYCLIEAAPGSKHFRSFGISFMFVYSGNQHVRRALIAVAIILILCSLYLLSAALILMNALRKEHELKFRHWLRAMAIFITFRLVILIFQSIVNDLYFMYHQLMLVLWFLLLTLNVFVWLVVYSNYQELSDITRLEDMAKLKMSTLSSLNASRSFSHHSLDSANPYGRYGGGTSSLQPSPQIYSHHHHHHQENPQGALSLAQSTGNLPSVSAITPSIQPRSHHSSQNSLAQGYLQMYSNTLSQRSRQSSAASLSGASLQNNFPMTAYGATHTAAGPLQHQHQLQQHQPQHQYQQHHQHQHQHQQHYGGPSHGAV